MKIFGEHRRVFIFSGSLIALLAFFILYMQSGEKFECSNDVRILDLRGYITAEIADKEEEHERGLSGHAPLAPDAGMLFIFNSSSHRDFWMKDMLFSLDIIWLDRDLRVISFYEDVRPDSYPMTFTSPESMQYALEVKSGVVKSRGIISGDKVTIFECTRR